ncbi:MAG: PadR family transcriptional regulator [Anaerolineae bacterium]
MTTVEIAVLGLIAEKPRHGYEIDAVIEERGMRNWTDIGFSSIYSALKRLEKAGLVTGQVQYQEPAPPKKVYHITAKGQEELKSQVARLLSAPKRPISEFDLGVANLPVLSKTEVIEHLRAYLSILEERISFLEKAAQEMAQAPFFVLGLFTRPLAHSRIERDWVRGFVEEIESQPDW